MIGVMFCCEVCGLKNRKVKVRCRYDNEDVVHWVQDAVMEVVGQTHRLLSPICNSTTISNICFGITDAAVKAGLGLGQQLPGEEPYYPDNMDEVIKRMKPV